MSESFPIRGVKGVSAYSRINTYMVVGSCMCREMERVLFEGLRIWGLRFKT